MADVLSKMELSSPCPHLCTAISCKKPSSAVRFPSRLLSLRISSNSDFLGRIMILPELQMKPKRGDLQPLHAQMSICISNAQKWWEKGIQPNMREIQSAQDLVDSLSNAGNKLVIVDFFSPGCGGCKALHPKICQIAEQNPDIQFLQIHKFKNALAKHTTDRCSLGPAKGLEESELLALAANKDLSFNYTRKEEATVPPQRVPMEAAPASPKVNILPSASKTIAPKDSEEKALVTADR